MALKKLLTKSKTYNWDPADLVYKYIYNIILMANK